MYVGFRLRKQRLNSSIVMWNTWRLCFQLLPWYSWMLTGTEFRYAVPTYLILSSTNSSLKLQIVYLYNKQVKAYMISMLSLLRKNYPFNSIEEVRVSSRDKKRKQEVNFHIWSLYRILSNCLLLLRIWMSLNNWALQATLLKKKVTVPVIYFLVSIWTILYIVNIHWLNSERIMDYFYKCIEMQRHSSKLTAELNEFPILHRLEIRISFFWIRNIKCLKSLENS